MRPAKPCNVRRQKHSWAPGLRKKKKKKTQRTPEVRAEPRGVEEDRLRPRQRRGGGRPGQAVQRSGAGDGIWSPFNKFLKVQTVCFSLSLLFNQPKEGGTQKTRPNWFGSVGQSWASQSFGFLVASFSVAVLSFQHPFLRDTSRCKTSSPVMKIAWLGFLRSS